MLIKLLDLTELVLGCYITVTWSFLTLSICCSAVYVRRSGTFPTLWKVARVTPVFKNRGSVSDPLFYRPVSVIPTLALLFERVIGSQMYNFIVR